MKRTAFLPVFFLVLGVIFAGAVWWRLSAYSDDASTTTTAASTTSSAPAVTTSASPENTMTIVPADDNGNAVDTSSTSAAARSREQRFNELLRSSPPPSAPTTATTAPEQPSLLNRVVNTAANVLGINRAKPVPPQQQPAPQPPPPQRVAQQQQQQHPSENNNVRDEPETRRDPDDPDTDVVAPQLLSADFNPPQVQDDGETILGVRATDNLSGVRSISGVISSPSGALQGFACQREGETDRFIARIKVPRDAAEGVWSVKYLTLTDNANNSVNLNQAAGALPPTASFRVVSSGSDSTAPVLKGVQIERRAMNAGDRNTVFVTAEDDKSGVSLVSGVFVSPSKQARIGFGCKPGNGSTWECSVSPPVCLDCGVWQLEQIQVQDKANNMATFRSDNPLIAQLQLDISGDKCDSGPPQITALSLDPPVVSNTEGGLINITAVVQDDACGVASLSGQAIPVGTQTGGQRIYFSFDPSQDGQNFFGRITVPRHAAKGVWQISWIQALDKGHNLKAYSSQDPVIARVTFRVE